MVSAQIHMIPPFSPPHVGFIAKLPSSWCQDGHQKEQGQLISLITDSDGQNSASTMTY